MSDTSDLVERLNIQPTASMFLKASDLIASLISEREEAATALTAKDKEIEALRERVKELETDLSDWRDLYSVENADRMSALARAETAERERDFHKRIYDTGERERARIERELDTMNDNHRAMAKLLADTGRERDEARAALKPFTRYSVGAIMKDDNFEYRIHVCCSVDDQPQFKHFDAARAVIKQGE